jgi:Porphobilinogen deaminase
MANPLRIASRRSQLAMVQTNWVRDELIQAHNGLEITIEAMATQGDKILDVALAKIGDKGLFTKELEAQMLVGQADIAVHSLKDLPTNLPEGLMLAASPSGKILPMPWWCMSSTGIGAWQPCPPAPWWVRAPCGDWPNCATISRSSASRMCAAT